MSKSMDLDAVYASSNDVVARDIDGELIIVPLTAAAAGADPYDALYTLNETGRAIWDRLDGRRSLREVITSLAEEYDAARGQIEADVLGLVGELVSRKMLVPAA